MQREAILIRDLDGTIRSTTSTLAELYGWLPEQALGHISHDLLRTRFPQALESIEAELLSSGKWEGELWHVRKDGTTVRVSSRWELQRDARYGTVVVEINRDASGDVRRIENHYGSSRIGTIVAILLLGAYGGIWLPGIPDPRSLALGLVGGYVLVWLAYFLISRQPKDELRKQLVLTTGSLIVVIGAFEVLAATKLVDYRRVFSIATLEEWENPIYRPDDELLWIHPPHLRLVGQYTRGNVGERLCLPPHAPEPFDLRYDQFGFRNEQDLQAAEVAVIGDSYVEAPYAPNSSLLTSVLSRLMAGPVANLGMSGYGPDQELAVLRQYAISLQAKKVVWVFFEGNDLENVWRNRELRATWPEPAVQGHSFAQRSFTKNALTAIRNVLAGCQPMPGYDKRYGIVKDGDRSVRLYFGEEPTRSMPRNLAALEESRAVFAEAHRLVQSHRSQLIVAFAPIAYRVYHDIASFDASSEIRFWTLNDLPQRLEAMLHGISPDINYLDLTPALASAARAGRLVYLPDDTHWTAEGHQVVAESIHQALSTPGH